LKTDVILDFDENNVPVSLGMLNASKVFNVKDKKHLVNFKDVNMIIVATEQVISSEVKISTIR
jgi:hypothetical protein